MVLTESGAVEERRLQMGYKLESQGRRIFDMIKFRALYFILEIKISAMGYLFGRVRSLKSIALILVGSLLVLHSSLVWANQWPWSFAGREFQVTIDPRDNFSPAIISNGSLYLAVWYRDTGSGFDIYGTRISPEGQILDKKGIPICIALDDQMFPIVTSDGENFLVVWQDRRSGKRWDIYGARVAADGRVLDPDGITIAAGRASNDGVDPAVSFDGDGYMVSWRGKRSSKAWNIYFTRVSREGEVLEGKPIQVSPSPKDQASPALAFNGTDYLIVWQDFRNGAFWDIYGARVAPSGDIIETDILISPIYQEMSAWDKWLPVLSWDGNFFMIVWMASRGEGRWYLEGKRVSSDGIPVDLLEIPIESGDSNKVFPVVLWDGDQHLLVWEEDPEGESKIYGASIFSEYKEFQVSEAIQISSTGGHKASMPWMARVKGEALIVWQAMGPEGYWQVYARHLKRESGISSVKSR